MNPNTENGADKAESRSSPSFLPGAPWEIIAPAALLAWRAASLPPNDLWRDWIAVLSLFWALTALTGKSKYQPVVTAAFIAFLLALYAWNQAPHALSVLGIAP